MVSLCNAGSMGKVLQRLGAGDQRSRREGDSNDRVTVKIPEHLEWMVWRVVSERIATLREIETYYDLVDLMDAHAVLDIKDQLEEKAARRAQKAQQ